MQKCADLEIGLQFQEAGKYAVDFRFHLPQSETDVRSAKAVTEIDPSKLLPFLRGSEGYGKALTSMLFDDPELRERFSEALAVSRQNELGLRLRLVIDPKAMDLHSLAWESLRNPQDGAPLCTNETVLFSRYLSSLDWRPVQLRHKDRMNALVVVSNPVGLEEYNLAPVNVQAEVGRARAALGGIPITLLGCETGGQPATLENLLNALRRRKADGLSYFDILWLIGHSALLKGETWLWLEEETGNVKRVSGSEIMVRFKELSEVPMLAVLSACESARSDENEALSALGPRLSQAGVPAVIAMQGKISMQTNATFTGAFFQALQEEGVVDHAITIARGQIREQPDAWMPALFMRLRSGQIWYLPGFGGKGSEIDIWESLRTFIQEGLCTVLLGTELIESVLGDGREIACQWAERQGYPFSSEDRDKFPQVAQFVSIYQNVTYLRITYQKALREAILQRFPQALPASLIDADRWKQEDLLQALDLAARAKWSAEKENPYQLLARLGLKIYVTTEQGDLLKQALVEAGLEPQVRLCPWNADIRKKKGLWFYEEDPTSQRPLVYHMFGHFQEPASLVYTHDDIYDYLISMTEHRDLIPDSVSAALADSALLFLGFQMDDWQFRILYRLILNQPGVEGLDEYSHVAAQIAPLEGLIDDEERARQVIQKYLERKRINLYWGTSKEFLNDLVQRL